VFNVEAPGLNASTFLAVFNFFGHFNHTSGTGALNFHCFSETISLISVKPQKI